MIRTMTLASLLALSIPAGAAVAQTLPQQVISGTRLDVVATGEVTRVPDIARISAGVVTTAPTATQAIAENNRRMASVREALKRAGIADRDIQTSSINLNPEYRYEENRAPVLTGYRASNEVSIRFRDIAETGAILDALVAQGANTINGPMLGLDKPEAAMDEARVEALRIARQRADLYAQSLGKRVTRILSVSESGSMYPPMPMMQMNMGRSAEAAADMKIDPGEQTIAVTVSVSFELQ